MRPRISLFSRCLLIAMAICLLSSRYGSVCQSIGSPSIHHRVSPMTVASSLFMTEVRLRKLHLARPDLIPYPIETEIYC